VSVQTRRPQERVHLVIQPNFLSCRFSLDFIEIDGPRQ